MVKYFAEGMYSKVITGASSKAQLPFCDSLGKYFDYLIMLIVENLIMQLFMQKAIMGIIFGNIVLCFICISHEYTAIACCSRHNAAAG